MLRAWRAAGPRGFDLKVARKLKGHTGPVSTVAFDQRNIYSGEHCCTWVSCYTPRQCTHDILPYSFSSITCCRYSHTT